VKLPNVSSANLGFESQTLKWAHYSGGTNPLHIELSYMESGSAVHFCIADPEIAENKYVYSFELQPH
jgi:hypothetical protein